MREIGSDEAYRLYACLEALAEHHNKVSANFKGEYPQNDPSLTIKKAERELDEGTAFIAVAEDEGEIIGFCKINTDGGKGVLEYLVVLERERGKDCGKALMDWAMDKFGKLGIKEIDVKVVCGNEAVRFYEKYGFKERSVILSARL